MLNSSMEAWESRIPASGLLAPLQIRFITGVSFKRPFAPSKSPDTKFPLGFTHQEGVDFPKYLPLLAALGLD